MSGDIERFDEWPDERDAFCFKVESSQSEDAKTAIALWQLAWAKRVVLGEIDEDGMTSIYVVLSVDWRSGPAAMVAWCTAKLAKNDESPK